MATPTEPAKAGAEASSAIQERFRTKGIDVQLEYVWTVVWSYLAAWTFGAPIVFPSSSPVWNGPGLFFLLCIGFYELQTGAYTNPSYWLKEFFADELSQRKFRKAPLDRALLMGAVDVFGHMTGYFLYLKTLEIFGEKAALEIAASPPHYSNCTWVWAFIVEAIVTSGTQLSSSVPEAIGLTGRVGNLVSSFIGVYILMIWGMPYTGAVMNPASSIAATVISGRFSKRELVNAFVVVRVLIVYICAPFAGAVVAGILEGGIERDRLKREKYE
jgi:glycerol uptake facilitator-like aquaporin